MAHKTANTPVKFSPCQNQYPAAISITTPINPTATVLIKSINVSLTDLMILCITTPSNTIPLFTTYLPPYTAFDPQLTGYQHIVNALFSINLKIDQLKKLTGNTKPACVGKLLRRS